MSKRCEWLGHKWKSEGYPRIVAGMMSQEQVCAVCEDTREHVEGLTADEPSKLSVLTWRYVFPTLMIGGAWWMASRWI